MRSIFFTLLLFSVSVSLSLNAVGREEPAGVVDCPQKLAQFLMPDFGLSSQTVLDAAEFAVTHGLPHKVIPVGWPEVPRYRLFVGLNADRHEVLAAYAQRFHFSRSSQFIGGYLIVEGSQTGGPSGSRTKPPSIRLAADMDSALYHHNKFSSDSWSAWYRDIVGAERGCVYDNIVPLSPERRTNADLYFRNPSLRATLSKNNCTTWVPNIELGQTGRNVDTAERHHLAHYLGIRRTEEHDEHIKRMIHASNENNPVVFVLYRGTGMDQRFINDISSILPPLPKIARRDIQKLVDRPPHNEPDAAALTAVSQIPRGARVFIPIGAGASPEGFRALVEQARAMAIPNAFTVHLSLNGLSTNLLSEASEVMDLRAFFIGRNLVDLSRFRRLNPIPVLFGQLARNIRERQPGFEFDAVLVRVSEPDAQGRHSLGANYDHTMDVIQANPGIQVIAEINPHIPHTTGNNFLLANQITRSFRSNEPLTSPTLPPVRDVERRIAQNIVSLIPSGATLQVGVGSVFEGLPEAFQAARKDNISIWTEAFGEHMRRLIEMNISPGASAGFAHVTPQTMSWLNNNPKVVFRSLGEILSFGSLAQQPQFHAVNTAFQINLDGEVNATIDATMTLASSPGGQVEFMMAGAQSPGGKAILAMRSTAVNPEGTLVSKVADFLYYGPITTPGYAVTHVVTEHGVAVLAGKTRAERALALIAIADPRFRAALAEGATKNGQITVAEARPFTSH